VAYVSALNLQSYKITRWQNQLGTALVEVGALSLVLTVVSLIFSAKLDNAFQWLAASMAVGAWLVDHTIKLVFDYRYFSSRDTRLQKEALDGNRKEILGQKGGEAVLFEEGG
jgi:hypothetical protein